MNRTSSLTLSGNIVMADKTITPGIVHIRHGKIEKIEEQQNGAGKVDIDVGTNIIGPGFIDMHVHGGNNRYFLSTHIHDIEHALRFHAKHGTTSLLATTTTASPEFLQAGLQCIRQMIDRQRTNTHASEAIIAGVHIEGPYINPQKAGGQDTRWIRLPSIEEYKTWDALVPIRMVTLAPEMAGSKALIEYIRSNSPSVLISAGHTNATLEEMEKAQQWGISHLTHFGNAMSGLHHRQPGCFGIGLMDAQLSIELIADTFHVHPKLLAFIAQVKADEQIALITDAVALCGMPDGTYEENGRTVIVNQGTIRLADGTLKGSALTMNVAVKNMVQSGVSLPRAWAMASTVPAKRTGLDHRKGTLRTGMDADIVILNDQFDVLLTMVEGSIIHQTF